MAITNYVKFVRGSAAAYQKKVNAGTIDNDTLYFIYESKDALTGQLYLGGKLLSGGQANLSDSSIGELKDMAIAEVGDRQLLIYDAEQEKWVNASIEDAIGRMVGASDEADGDDGLVPAPKIGDENKFLRGDGQWASPEEYISAIDDSFQVIDGTLKLADNNYLLTETDKKKLNDLVIDEDGKVAVSGTISAANVEGLDELLADKAEVEEVENLKTTVEELSKIINGETDAESGEVVSISLNDRVSALEELLNGSEDDEAKEGIADKIESLDAIINGIVDEESGEVVGGLSQEIADLSTSVGDISSLIDYRSEEEKEEDEKAQITIVDAINNIYERLTWEDLEEEVSEEELGD